ncbi:Smr/MutS family protein [Sphingomonas sp. G124]|uniref:Smr/MutS family protein n=1 Tax=Sphingomonas cremea TaxID=2904799 RepID=A0A9X1QM46_9SPHN|nr:Smr/MutS family protein [Sphingomonas cremea]MCF2513904.1 Smr/MutS family protein [Sphingomonas cremea]
MPPVAWLAECLQRVGRSFCSPRELWLVRKLSPEEAALWAKVTETIRPLSRDPTTEPVIATKPGLVTPVGPKGRVPPSRAAELPPKRTKNLSDATLDGGWDRRLGSGRVQPDRALDLHGHSLDQAWTAIDRALEQAIASNDRVLLLVTGHERKGEPPLERGRIRAAVHDWLAVSRHANRIAAVRGAHRRHGGGGSLYIILRKA